MQRFFNLSVLNIRSVRNKRHRIWPFLLIFVLLMATMVSGAGAADIIPAPPPELYVLDQADVIDSSTEALIINTSKELNRLTKAQVAVVTLNTLDDQSLEEVSLGILRQWKLGDKELNNGLLVLVVPSERKSRIEVGYGLEGALPDAKTGRIQDEYMLPDFKAGNYDRGLRNGYLQLANEVAGEYGVQLDVQPSQPRPQTDKTTGNGLPFWADFLLIIGALMLFWLDHRFFNGFIFGMLLSMLFRGGGRGGGGGFGGSSGGGGSGGGGGSSRGW
jgi:uncharacterized protein